MTREELIQFLKDHLTISVEYREPIVDYGYTSGGTIQVRIAIVLEGQEIAIDSSETTIS